MDATVLLLALFLTLTGGADCVVFPTRLNQPNIIVVTSIFADVNTFTLRKPRRQGTRGHGIAQIVCDALRHQECQKCSRFILAGWQAGAGIRPELIKGLLGIGHRVPIA